MELERDVSGDTMAESLGAAKSSALSSHLPNKWESPGPQTYL